MTTDQTIAGQQHNMNEGSSVNPQGVIPTFDQSSNTGNPNPLDDNPGPKEQTRSTMAILFILGFFAILFLCFVYAIKVGAKLSELKDSLVGIIGALSGIIGFIVGYYYKNSHE